MDNAFTWIILIVLLCVILTLFIGKSLHRDGNTLPKYMLPVVYHRLPELKRNTNGKIDRLYYSKLVEG